MWKLTTGACTGAFFALFIFILANVGVHAQQSGNDPQQQFLRKRTTVAAAENLRSGVTYQQRHHRQQLKQKEQDEFDIELADALLRRYLEEFSSIPANEKTDDEDDETDKQTATASVTSTSKQPPWTHELGDIPIDPDIVFGELENGMRYQLRTNQESVDHLEMRLHIDAGANMEQEDELGIAHFLEHMAFQTLRNFPLSGGSVGPIFQRLGLGFGSHINAYTNFHETVYTLGLPNLHKDTIRTAFTWFRDVCDGIIFQDNEINTERGVVLSELQDKDSVGDRIWEQTLDWLIPDHLRSSRDVIGTEETISSITKEQLINFYETYYVTRRAVLSLVGSMSTAEMEELVHEYFDDWEDSGDRGIEPSYGNLTVNEGFRSTVMVDNEIAFDRLTIDGNRAYDTTTADTEKRRVDRMKLSIAHSIVSKRLNRLADDPETSITRGGAGVSRWYSSIEFPYVWVTPKKGLWRESVGVLEKEFRRVLIYGFTQAELDEVKANRLNFFEQQVLAQETRSSKRLIGDLVGTTNGDYVASTPEEDLRIVSLGLQYITTDDLQQLFSRYWNTSDINLYLTTSTLNGTNPDEAAKELRDLYFDSTLEEVTPPVEEEVVPFAYTDFGPPGTIVSDNMVEDLKIRQLVLSNNIRVNIKTTNLAAENIRVICRFGTGKLGQPQTESMSFLDDFTDYLIEQGGLGRQSSNELNRALAGKNVNLNMFTGDGFFRMSGSTNPDDLELQLQLLAAHFVDPGFREEAVRSWRANAPSYKSNLQHTLQNTFDYEMYGWLLGNDERFNEPSLDELLAMEIDDAKEWITPHLERSYLEISLVGDLNETVAVEYILQTFGAMPERDDARASVPKDDRTLSIPQAPLTHTITYETKVPNAATMAIWRIPSLAMDNVTIVESRKFDVLQSVIRERMREKIREELGGSYSPRAWTTQNHDFDYGFLFAYSEGEPEEMELLNDAIMGISKNITENIEGEITPDELSRALLPLKSRIEDSRARNGYWLYTVLQESQAEPFHLDWERTRVADYDSITVDELNDLAKQYLKQDQALQVFIMPVNMTSVSK